MSKHEFNVGDFKIDLTNMVPTNGGKTRTLTKRGERHGTVSVTLDVSKLGEMARKALGAKSGKATAIFGAVVCKRTSHNDVLNP